MATTSIRLLNHNVDTSSALLIAQLALEDINAFYRTTGNRTGSDGRHDESTLSDVEYAFQLQAEDYKQFLVTHGCSVNLEKNNSSHVHEFLVDASDESDDDELNASSSDSDVELTEIIQDLPPSPETCVVCTDIIPPTGFKASCHHYYCKACLENYLATCIDNENMFPPRCCEQTLPLDDLQLSGRDPSSSSSKLRASFRNGGPFDLNYDLVSRFLEKSAEFKVTPLDRLYCCNAVCSRFLGSRSILKAAPPDSKNLTTLQKPNSASTECRDCHTKVCLTCKKRAHPDLTCQEAQTEEDLVAETQVRDLAKEKKWKTCPGCREMVELNGGCPHVTCRCKHEFCYICGGNWPAIRDGQGVCICG